MNTKAKSSCTASTASPQPELTAERRHELDLRAGEVDRGGGDEEVLDARRLDAVLERHVVEKDVVDRGVEVAGLDAEAGRGVPLWIEVDDEHPVAEIGEGRSEVDGGRGLADPALLVRHREDAGERPASRGHHRGEGRPRCRSRRCALRHVGRAQEPAPGMRPFTTLTSTLPATLPV